MDLQLVIVLLTLLLIMKVSDKEIIQSYIVTAARYDFSVYEKRILYRIVEKLQFTLEGKKLDTRFVIEKNLFNDFRVEIPISEFLNGEEDKNYNRVKTALLSLNKKVIEVEDEKSWSAFNILERPKIEKNEGVARFTLSEEIYTSLLNFAKGYKKFELKTAFQFESVYSMRFYELFSNQQTKLIYSIEALKKMFAISAKYNNRPSDFITFVIKVAKIELDKKSPYSFDFVPQKTGRKITHIAFYPIKTKNIDERIEKKQAQRKSSPRWVLSREVIHSLREKYSFGEKEIKVHIDLLGRAQNELDLLSLLSFKSAYCQKRNNPIGSLIAIIKHELNDLNS